MNKLNHFDLSSDFLTTYSICNPTSQLDDSDLSLSLEPTKQEQAGTKKCKAVEQKFRLSILKEELLSTSKVFNSSSSNIFLKKLPKLDVDSTKEILDLLAEEFEIIPLNTSKPKQKTTIKKLLRKLLDNMKIHNKTVVVKDVLIIGGMTNLLLKPSYWKQVYKQIGISEEKLDLFSNPEKEPNQKLLGQRGDCDILLDVKISKTKDIYSIRSTLISTLQHLFNDKIEFDIILQNYFEKITVINDEANLVLIAKIGDRQGKTIEIKISAKQALPYLFPQDAFAISFLNLLNQSTQPGPVICRAQNILQTFYCHQTDNLWVEQPKLVNKQGLPRYLSHLTLGKTSQQIGLGYSLKENCLKNYTELNSILEFFQKHLNTHHAKDPIIAIAFYLNACLSRFDLFTVEQKKTVWQEIKKSITIPKSDSLLGVIDQILDHSPHLLQEVISFLQLCAALHFFGHPEEWNEDREIGILIKQLEGEEHFKICFQERSKQIYTLWLPCHQVFNAQQLTLILKHFPLLAPLYNYLATPLIKFPKEETNFFKAFLTSDSQNQLYLLSESLLNSINPLSCHFGLKILVFLQTTSSKHDLSLSALQALPHALLFDQDRQKQKKLLKTIEEWFNKNHSISTCSPIFAHLNQCLEAHDTLAQLFNALILDLIQLGDSKCLEKITEKILIHLNHTQPQQSSIHFFDPQILSDLVKGLIQHNSHLTLSFLEKIITSSAVSLPYSLELFFYYCSHYRNVKIKIDSQISLLEKITIFLLENKTNDFKSVIKSENQKTINWLIQYIASQNLEKSFDLLIQIVCNWLDDHSSNYEEMLLFLIKAFISKDTAQAYAIWKKFLYPWSCYHYPREQIQLICQFIEKEILLSRQNFDQIACQQLILKIQETKLVEQNQALISKTFASYLTHLITLKNFQAAATSLTSILAISDIKFYKPLMKKIICELIKQNEIKWTIHWLTNLLSQIPSTPSFMHLIHFTVRESAKLSTSLNTISDLGKWLKKLDNEKLFKDDLTTKFTCWQLISHYLIEYLNKKQPSCDLSHFKICYTILNVISSDLLPTFYQMNINQDSSIYPLTKVIIDFLKLPKMPLESIPVSYLLKEKYIPLSNQLNLEISVFIEKILSFNCHQLAYDLIMAIVQNPDELARLPYLALPTLAIVNQSIKEKTFPFQNTACLLNLTAQQLLKKDNLSQQFTQTIYTLNQTLHLTQRFSDALALIQLLLNIQLLAHDPLIPTLIWQLIEACYTQQKAPDVSLWNELKICKQKQMITIDQIIRDSQTLMNKLIQQESFEKIIQLLTQLQLILDQEFARKDWTSYLKEILKKLMNNPINKVNSIDILTGMTKSLSFFQKDFDTEWTFLIKDLLQHRLIPNAWKVFEELCQQQTFQEEQTKKDILFELIKYPFSNLKQLKNYLSNPDCLILLLGPNSNPKDQASIYQFIIINLLKTLKIKSNNENLILKQISDKRHQISELLNLPENETEKSAIDLALTEALLNDKDKESIQQGINYFKNVLLINSKHFHIRENFNIILNSLYEQWQSALKDIPKSFKQNTLLFSWTLLETMNEKTKELKNIIWSILTITELGYTNSLLTIDQYKFPICVLAQVLPMTLYSIWLDKNSYLLDFFKENLQHNLKIFEDFCLACLNIRHRTSLNSLKLLFQNSVTREILAKSPKFPYLSFRLLVVEWSNQRHTIRASLEREEIFSLFENTMKNPMFNTLYSQELNSFMYIILDMLLSFILDKDKILTSGHPEKKYTAKIFFKTSQPYFESLKNQYDNIFKSLSFVPAVTIKIKNEYKLYIIKGFYDALINNKLKKDILDQVLTFNVFVCQTLLDKIYNSECQSISQLALDYVLQQALINQSSFASHLFEKLLAKAKTNQIISRLQELEYLILHKMVFNPPLKEISSLSFVSPLEKELINPIKLRIISLLQSKQSDLFLHGIELFKIAYNNHYYTNNSDPELTANLLFILNNTTNFAQCPKKMISLLIDLLTHKCFFDKLVVEELSSEKTMVKSCQIYLLAFDYIIKNYYIDESHSWDLVFDYIYEKIKEYIIKYKKINAFNNINIICTCLISSLTHSQLILSLQLRCIEHTRTCFNELRSIVWDMRHAQIMLTTLEQWKDWLIDIDQKEVVKKFDYLIEDLETMYHTLKFDLSDHS